MTPTPQDQPELSYEQARDELVTVVQRLESGGVPLDELLADDAAVRTTGPTPLARALVACAAGRTPRRRVRAAATRSSGCSSCPR